MAVTWSKQLSKVSNLLGALLHPMLDDRSVGEIHTEHADAFDGHVDCSVLSFSVSVVGVRGFLLLLKAESW